MSRNIIIYRSLSVFVCFDFIGPIITADDETSQSEIIRRVKKTTTTTTTTVVESDTEAPSEVSFSERSDRIIRSRKPPRFLNELLDIEVLEGSTAKFDARVTGRPMPRIRWYSDGIEVHPGEKYTLHYDDLGHCSLTIHTVKRDDTAEIECRAVNAEGEEVSSFADLIVKPIPRSERRHRRRRETQILFEHGEKPRFVQPCRPQEILEGYTARFTCRVSGRPTPTVTWFKDGRPIPSDERFEITYEEDGTCTLTILEVTIDEDAEYMCKAVNQLGKAITYADLTVQFESTDRSRDVSLITTTIHEEPEEEGSWTERRVNKRFEDGQKVVETVTTKTTKTTTVKTVTSDHESGTESVTVELPTRGPRPRQPFSQQPIEQHTQEVVITTGDWLERQQRERVETEILHQPARPPPSRSTLLIQPEEPFVPISEDTVLPEERAPPQFSLKPLEKIPDLHPPPLVREYEIRPETKPKPKDISLKPLERISVPQEPATVHEPEIKPKVAPKPKSFDRLDKLPVPIEAPEVHEPLLEPQEIVQAQQPITFPDLPEPEYAEIVDETIHQERIYQQQRSLEFPELEEPRRSPPDRKPKPELAVRPLGAPSYAPSPHIPYVIQELRDIRVTVGQEARLECIIDGYPTPRIMWLREGRPLEGDRFLSIQEQDGTCTLVITVVIEEDEGEYEVRATNQLGTTSSFASLIIHIGDALRRHSPESTTVTIDRRRPPLPVELQIEFDRESDVESVTSTRVHETVKKTLHRERQTPQRTQLSLQPEQKSPEEVEFVIQPTVPPPRPVTRHDIQVDQSPKVTRRVISSDEVQPQVRRRTEVGISPEHVPPEDIEFILQPHQKPPMPKTQTSEITTRVVDKGEEYETVTKKTTTTTTETVTTTMEEVETESEVEDFPRRPDIVELRQPVTRETTSTVIMRKTTPYSDHEESVPPLEMSFSQQEAPQAIKPMQEYIYPKEAAPPLEFKFAQPERRERQPGPEEIRPESPLQIEFQPSYPTERIPGPEGLLPEKKALSDEPVPLQLTFPQPVIHQFTPADEYIDEYPPMEAEYAPQFAENIPVQTPRYEQIVHPGSPDDSVPVSKKLQPVFPITRHPSPDQREETQIVIERREQPLMPVELIVDVPMDVEETTRTVTETVVEVTPEQRETTEVVIERRRQALQPVELIVGVKEEPQKLPKPAPKPVVPKQPKPEFEQILMPPPQEEFMEEKPVEPETQKPQLIKPVHPKPVVLKPEFEQILMPPPQEEFMEEKPVESEKQIPQLIKPVKPKPELEKVPEETVKKVERPTVVKPVENVDVTIGSEVRLECQIVGEQPLTVNWFRDDIPAEGDRYTSFVERGVTYVLLINPVTDDDDTDFKCVATNPGGTVFSKAEVYVMEKPSEISEVKIAKETKPLELELVISEGEEKPETRERTDILIEKDTQPLQPVEFVVDVGQRPQERQPEYAELVQPVASKPKRKPRTPELAPQACSRI